VGEVVMGFPACAACRDGKSDIDSPRQPLPGERASRSTIERLLGMSKLPVMAIPKATNLHRSFELKQVFVADYENGVELTCVFEDAERPNSFTDAIADAVSAPFLGRPEHLVTFYINGTSTPTSLEFPSTYSGGCDWQAGMPIQGTATVPFGRFERAEHREWAALKAATRASLASKPRPSHGPIVYVNTWSRLLAETNNNANLPLAYYSVASGASSGGSSSPGMLSMQKLAEPDTPSPPAQLLARQLSYPLFHGSRAEVDAKCWGLIRPPPTPMSSQRAASLGKRMQPELRSGKPRPSDAQLAAWFDSPDHAKLADHERAGWGGPRQLSQISDPRTS